MSIFHITWFYTFWTDHISYTYNVFFSCYIVDNPYWRKRSYFGEYFGENLDHWGMVSQKYSVNNGSILLTLTLLFIYLFYCCSSTVVSIFTPPQPPTLDPTPFGFVPVSFILVPWWTFPNFLPLSLSSLPYGYCQFVLYFSVSGYIS